MISKVNHFDAVVVHLTFLLLTTVPWFADVAAGQRQDFQNIENAVPPGWKVVSGEWRVKDGVLVADSLKSDAYITFGESSWQNYEMEAEVTFREIRDTSRWLSILVRATPDGEKPWSQVPVRFDTSESNGMEFAVRTASGSWSVRRKAAAASASQLNRARRMKVTVRGSQVQAWLDGQRVINSHLCVDRPAGCVGLGASGCIATFDNVSVRQLPPTADSPVISRKPSDNVAHRGFSAVAPENTLAAIREAVKAGASGCEFDVYACRDGTVVLMHDKTVDRTTDGTGLVTELSLKQLRELDAGSWKNARYRGEQVPTLIEALKLLKQTDCQPVIEIKMEGISKQVVSDIRSLDMVDQVAVIAFSKSVVSEIRALEPRLQCAWLCGETIDGTPKQQADWLQSRAEECNAKLLDLNFKMLSPELIAELKRRDLGVWTWTVNETVVMRALQQWGVDSITTDRPDLLDKLAN